MKKKGTEPPSLFDNLDLFAQPPEPPDGESGSSEAGNEAAPMESASKPAVEVASSPAETSLKGLTGRGPMRDLYDFNFRQYSAYVICSRAIPAVEDGLKPVQRRIMHSL